MIWYYEGHLINMWKIYFPGNCQHYVHYKECLWEIVAVDYVSYRQHGIELLDSSLGLCFEGAQFESCPLRRLG